MFKTSCAFGQKLSTKEFFKALHSLMEDLRAMYSSVRVCEDQPRACRRKKHIILVFRSAPEHLHGYCDVHN